MRLPSAILLVTLWGLLSVAAQEVAPPDPLSPEAGPEQLQLYLDKFSTVDQPWERLVDRNRDGVIEERELGFARKRMQQILLRDGQPPQEPHPGPGIGDDTDPVPEAMPDPELEPELQPDPIPAVSRLEKRYDADGNGELSPEEAAVLFKDRLTLARAAGAVIIASDLERAADLDGDGMLMSQEVEWALKKLSIDPPVPPVEEPAPVEEASGLPE